MSEKPNFRSATWILLCLCAGLLLWIWTGGRDSSPGSAPNAPASETSRKPSREVQPSAATDPQTQSDESARIATAAADSQPEPAPDDTPVRNLPLDFLDRIVSGKTVSFPLPDGSQASGDVQMIERDKQGVLFVQGRLTTPHPGFYFFQRQTATGLAGPLVGHVRFDDKDDAWKIEPDATFAAARMVSRKIDDIICASYAHAPEAAEGDVEEAPQKIGRAHV